MTIATAIYFSPYNSRLLYSVINNRTHETRFESTNKEEALRMMKRLARSIESPVA